MASHQQMKKMEDDLKQIIIVIKKILELWVPEIEPGGRILAHV